MIRVCFTPSLEGQQVTGRYLQSNDKDSGLCLAFLYKDSPAAVIKKP